MLCAADDENHIGNFYGYYTRYMTECQGLMHTFGNVNILVKLIYR